MARKRNKRKVAPKRSPAFKAYKAKKLLAAIKAKAVKGRHAAKFSYKDQHGKDRRDERGHFLSWEDWIFRRKEIEQRRRDYTRDKKRELARELREAAQRKEKRQKALARAERQWEKGTRTRKGKLKRLFSDRVAGHTRTVADDAQLAAGELPDAHAVKRIGKYGTYKWVYYGADAISTAENFIIEARAQLEPGTLGSVRIGTGYDKKRGRWVSTAILPLKANMAHGKDLMSALFRLLASESGQNVFGSEQEEDVWVEIELLMK